MIPGELSEQYEVIQPRVALSHSQLAAASALVLAFTPVAVVSMLPQTQFDEALPTGLAALLALLGFAWAVRRNTSLSTQRPIAVLVLAIFALRLCAALLIGRWWWWPQAVTMPGNDWDVYENLGWNLARSGMSLEILMSYPLNDVGIVYLIGALYSFVGHNPLVLTVLFTLLGAWIALDVADLVALTGETRASGRAAVMASLVPSSLLFASIPDKDILVIFFFVKLLLIARRMHGVRGWKAWKVGKSFALVFGMGNVRATSIPLLLLSLVGISALIVPKARKSLIAFTVVLACAGFLTLTWRVQELGREISFSPTVISQFVYERTRGPSATLSQAGLTFTTDEESSIIVRTFWNGEVSRAYLIPLRAVLLFFVPFPPVNFTKLDMAMGSLNTFMMLLLLPAVWVATAYSGGSWQLSLRKLSWLWVPLVTNMMVLSAAFPFAQIRYSLLAQFLFAGLAAVGLRKSNLVVVGYLILPFAFAILVLLYIVIKNSWALR